MEQNPSDHPTIVLSQINHQELRLLVEFMYSGEVAVEQDCLAKLLEAANMLQIKGLYESADQEKTEDHQPKEVKSEPEQPEKPPEPIGSQKRKRRKSPDPELPNSVKKVWIV